MIEIVDANDPRLADYVALREVNLRRSLESAEGLFIAEGEKVITRAVQAGYRPRSFLLAERWLAPLRQVLAAHPDVPIYLVTEELVEQVTGFHVHRGALASLHRELRHRVEDLLELNRLVVLEDIVDHTNVGAILRNAAALGWDGAVLAPRAADPLYRRSIKVSMGAVFSLPWARSADWDNLVPTLSSFGYSTVALALTDDAVDLAEVSNRPTGKIAILVGTEGTGLSDRWLRQADVVARIPMHAGVDSLNVAAATAVACYLLGADQARAETLGDTGQSSG